jgi:uncharacterized DUF497 family protein
MEFEWDPEKAEQNFIHHGIDFDDAIAIFDGATLDFEDGTSSSVSCRLA